MDFDYAHRDTSVVEKSSYTEPFNKISLPDGLESIIESAHGREIPVSDRETLTFLSALVSALKPRRILEIGTAVGVSAAAMLCACANAHITTVERDAAFSEEARQNFIKLNMSSQIELIEGDAGQVIEELTGPYDFIFLDGAKAQYVKYLPRLKSLLEVGGVLLADDVLLFGYVTGETQTPKKRKMLVEHLKEYIAAVTADPDFITAILNTGNGLAMSVKKV